MFYLDVPLAETLTRHQARPLVGQVPADKIREWYVRGDTLGVTGEIVLDGTADLNTTLGVIRASIGTTTNVRGERGHQFL